MNRDELDRFAELMSKPGPEEEAFFARRQALCLGSGIDENGRLVKQKGPVFIDFEASSLSENSWPIEVGLAWLEGKRVVVESKLIQPRPEWLESDWNMESEAVHGIPRSDLEAGETADDVASWLLREAENGLLVSDAPPFDQQWLDRLLGQPGPRIANVDDVFRGAFSSEGCVSPGRLHRAYRNMRNRPTEHRAGPDAANLAYAWRAGIGT